MGSKTQFITAIKDFVTGAFAVEYSGQLMIVVMILCEIVFLCGLGL